MESRYEGITEEQTSYAFRIYSNEPKKVYLRYVCTYEDKFNNEACRLGWLGSINSNGKGILDYINNINSLKEEMNKICGIPKEYLDDK